MNFCSPESDWVNFQRLRNTGETKAVLKLTSTTTYCLFAYIMYTKLSTANRSRVSIRIAITVTAIRRKWLRRPAHMVSVCADSIKVTYNSFNIID